MSIISIETLAIGILLSCITLYVVKYIDVIAVSILKNKKLSKTLISIDILIFIITSLLIIDWIFCKLQQINTLLKLQ
ncbi:hypothetical protein SAMN02194393_02458 [Maledivibacter halophilus]|uniref:Uncharacterized protein n=1 Tax=Maledivibacter halophilus TaxID=36842 RepID=A0A1T5L550_9FIRM|nr:hypothetical protein SAMN02194393_02458 [Maledivibacter halophilus]